MPRQISPSNAWCFTLNNYTKIEYEFLSSSFSNESERYFYIIGKEVGANGTPHLQGYVALKDRKKKFRPLPKFGVFRGENDNKKQAIHFERARGNRKQNYEYCSKDGEFITNIDVDTYATLKTKFENLKKRVVTIQQKIDEIFEEVNVVDEDSYNVAAEIAKTWMDERSEICEKIHIVEEHLENEQAI